MQANELKIEIDFNKLGFEIVQTEWMYVSYFKDNKWDDGKIMPYGPIEIFPSANILSYGQGIFEGLKALKSKDNHILLFRPIENAKRFNISAERLAMPSFDNNKFLKAIEEVVLLNKKFIPPYNSGGALYIRPIMIGSGPMLGVAPANEFMVMIYCSPVGSYFNAEGSGIELLISKKYTRSSQGGTGYSKMCGNYAGILKPAKEAKKLGYDEVIYLDSIHMKYISEVGAANFCTIIDGKLVTPKRDGTILEGITLKSVLDLAKKELKIPVRERDISYEELFKPNCTEAFCTGTAAVITPIGSITYGKKRKEFNNKEPGEITKTIYNLLTSIQRLDKKDKYNWVEILE
ncbi:MAG: branched-chain amino acid aminotransferase [Candidatus Lokiarchaeota archaeon]|nr:branched-chain amino acid aminotransferase [Candidatus Lokiarchaeota archaeon]